MKDNSHKTAISRKSPSVPLKYLIKSGKIAKKHKVLDFGCGRGGDINFLTDFKYNINGYDPYWYQNEKALLKKYDIVLCTYVLNVVNKPTQLKIINQLKDLTNKAGKVYITVRRDIKKHRVSSRGTHQYCVKLPFKIVKETSSYCIYEITNEKT